MSSKTTFELNYEGVRELLRSDEMKELLTDLAEGIQKRAGDGYEVSPYTGKTRVNVSVGTATFEAMQDNLDNNTLLKALG